MNSRLSSWAGKSGLGSWAKLQRPNWETWMSGSVYQAAMNFLESWTGPPETPDCEDLAGVLALTELTGADILE